MTDILDDFLGGLLAFAKFPPAHRQQIWATNPLERLQKKTKRRPNVIIALPHPATLMWPAGHELIEQHDE